MENSRLAERENGMGKREDLGKEEHAISNGSLTGVGQREQQIKEPQERGHRGGPARTDQAPCAQPCVSCKVPAERTGCVIRLWRALWDFSSKKNTFQTRQQNVLRRTPSCPG